MGQRIEFKAKVLKNYRVLIPKASVTRNPLWVRRRIDSRLKPGEYTDFKIKLIEFGSP